MFGRREASTRDRESAGQTAKRPLIGLSPDRR